MNKYPGKQTVQEDEGCVIITDKNGKTIHLECEVGDEIELYNLIRDNSYAIGLNED